MVSMAEGADLGPLILLLWCFICQVWFVRPCASPVVLFMTLPRAKLADIVAGNCKAET